MITSSWLIEETPSIRSFYSAQVVKV